MKVLVSTFANLRDYVPGGGACEMTLSVGASVKDLMAALHIPSQIDAVILVNGRRANPDTVLNAGDSVTLFPPMEGG